METFSALLAICAGNSPGIPRTKASDAELWYFIDLKRHRAHYDVIVMIGMLSGICGEFVTFCDNHSDKQKEIHSTYNCIIYVSIAANIIFPISKTPSSISPRM